eukprot:gnl/TRDRNA2_/TRDRNA2_122468_c3_seq1.p1 gnl/TRDRNA2_/TRDRNA2_122468_c3~~gnl/TRDRNA2_/TRDRNA2_122468_c3_seq1.p1  ORF type:complete len:244 (+),score=33.42 gnl/TRDRNA2_/TRDRNA2_122468_c3_seq1:75-734(+)
MSSFAFDNADEGAPGIESDPIEHRRPKPVFDKHRISQCRSTPRTSPVTLEYETAAKPWVCEHRWEGVAGLVRFRRLFHREQLRVTEKWSPSDGRVAFRLGDTERGFVALNRGWNSDSKTGSDEVWDLSGMRVGMPSGTYCNLALQSAPVDVEDGEHCVGETVIIGTDTAVEFGRVPSGGALAIHMLFMKQAADDDIDPIAPLDAAPASMHASDSTAAFV